MHFRLDAQHRLVYDIKTMCWYLQKCSAYAKFDNTQYEAMKKAEKRILILNDKSGNKYFGKWASLGSFSNEKLGNAFMSWLHSLIDIKLGDKELDIKTVMDTFNMIKESISEIVMLSTIFRIKVDLVPVQSQDFDRLIAEEKKARKSANAIKKKIPPGGLTGPDTIFATSIHDTETERILRLYSVNVDNNGVNVVINNKPVLKSRKLASSFDQTGRIETVTVKDIGEMVKIRGRQSVGSGRKEESITIDNQIKEKKRRGRPPKNKETPVVPSVLPATAENNKISALKPKTSGLVSKSSILKPKVKNK